MVATVSADNGSVSGSAGIKLSSDSSGVLALQTGANSTAMTLDTSGNVGIGTSTPIAVLDVASGSNPAVRIRNTSTGGAGIWFVNSTSGTTTGDGSNVGIDSSQQLNLWNYENTATLFATNNTERMRIDSSGNLLVGATSTVAGERLNVTVGNATGILVKNTGGADSAPIYYWNATTTGNGYFAAFFTETSASFRGSITYNRAAGLISYNTTSDYRAKTVNGLVENALSKVVLLKPSTGRMNGATEDIDFFVAHELQQVVPSAVIGEKDAVNEDNTPKYQVVDKSALIPLLTAAIQELKAINDTQAETINALTARIVALEGQ